MERENASISAAVQNSALVAAITAGGGQTSTPGGGQRTNGCRRCGARRQDTN
ncbi:MAG: hypothetical protein ACLVJX_09030 [Merdibacter sp.]